jgi:SNF2 family DNA or RNA helicase
MDAKINALMKELDEMQTKDKTAKAIVFTQFGDTMTYLEQRLARSRIPFQTIKGSMTLPKRKLALENFDKCSTTSVFLLSVRAGAVGLTLTAANHVFLMEPCLNPALEKQAIGRVVRIGQKREVTVKCVTLTQINAGQHAALTTVSSLRYFVSKDTVEERIMLLNNNKLSAADPASSAPSSFSGSGAGGAGSLQKDEVGGMLKADEMRILFS